MARPLLPTLALAGLLAGAAAPQAAWGQAAGSTGRVAQAGLRPLDPPTQAKDLELPSLGGGRGRISDHRGHWLFLTFFASWCGPCRSEMPSLQRLNDALQDDGLEVVGVSLDGSLAEAQRFTRELGVSFPVLWDESGEAAATYRASSIPLSYLVDPEGRIVGVARGARDWSRSQPAFENLLAINSDLAPGEDASYDQAAGPIELPTLHDPPTARAELATPNVRPGVPFALDVRVEWAGKLQDYLLHPPTITLPEGVEQIGISAESSSLEGRSVLTYRAELLADEAGRYDLDPIELSYTPAFEAAPVATSLVGPTVEVVQPTIAGLRPATFAALIGGGAVVALLLAVGLWRWRRRPLDDSAPPSETFRRALTEARQLRLAGDLAGFLGELTRLETEITGEGPDEATLQLLEEVRYGGAAPAPQELDRRQRRVERLLEQLAPSSTASRLRFSSDEAKQQRLPKSLQQREEVSR